ncbi:MAG: ribosome maturation factor RimM [Firmicutes bacterium]|nr:ribosome maturation factor RimM [Bacillota bacterium]
MKNLLIGIILKPRGLKGELKVKILTNKPEVFFDLEHVFLDDTKHDVVSSSIQNGFGYITLKGLNKFELVDDLRDQNVYITKDQMIIEDDEVLVTDLIGFAVVDTLGKVLGTLRAIENYGAGEILVVNDELNIPYEDDFIMETNMTEKKIVVKTSKPVRRLSAKTTQK